MAILEKVAAACFCLWWYRHCHVDAGPDRRETMTRETMALCLPALEKTTTNGDRSEISGLANIPDDEPSMLVGNHDGGYLFPDACCMGSFYYSGFGTAGRRLYALMHDFPFRIAPTLTEWLQRCGVIPGYALLPGGGLCDTTFFYRTL